jgi:hypothetical protein
MQAFQRHRDEARQANELASVLVAAKDAASGAADEVFSVVGHRSFLLAQRSSAACRALSCRSSAVSALARAFPSTACGADDTPKLVRRVLQSEAGNIRGNSYRLKGKLKAGLVKPVEATT